MNAERLLAHYEQIADAPDTIARLRRFILDLAVRGKLVPQDLTEEPASELLKRIGREKARLLKAREIRAPKAIPAQSEAPYSIPSNWRWSQLAEIGVLSPRNDAPDTLQASFVSMPMIAAEYGVAHQHEVRSWGEIKKGYTHFAEGDVGLAKITPCFENGKSTVFRNLAGGIGSGTTELHIVRPLFVQQDYILLFLKCPYFIQTGIPKMTGTAGQKRVPSEYFAHSPFPLPPLAEQRRIVAKVDELMGLCDRLEAARAGREAVRDRLAAASLARLNAPDPDTFQADARFALDALPALTTRPDQIKALRQTILNLAPRGKLVRQDPKDEHSGETLARHRSAGGNGRVRRNVPDSVAVPPELQSLALPPGWSLESVAGLLRTGALSDLKDGNHGANHPKVSEFVVEGLPFITAAQVTDDGRIDYESAYKLAGPPLDRLRVGFARSGDVIYTHKGSVGRVALCDRDCVLSPQTTYYRPNASILGGGFLRIMLLSDLFRGQVDSVKRQTTRDFVSIQKQYEFFLLVPPLAEQHRILAKVNALMVLCDRLEVNLTATATTRRRLLDALLAEALAPTDERDLEAAE